MVSPVGTGRSRASKVIAMATTASEKATRRSVARDSNPRSSSDTRQSPSAQAGEGQTVLPSCVMRQAGSAVQRARMT